MFLILELGTCTVQWFFSSTSLNSRNTFCMKKLNPNHPGIKNFTSLDSDGTWLWIDDYTVVSWGPYWSSKCACWGSASVRALAAVHFGAWWLWVFGERQQASTSINNYQPSSTTINKCPKSTNSITFSTPSGHPIPMATGILHGVFRRQLTELTFSCSFAAQKEAPCHASFRRANALRL